MLRLPARGAKQMTGAQGGMHARTCARTHTYSTSSDTHRRFIDRTRHIAGCRSTLMEDLHLIRCTEWGRTFGSTKKKNLTLKSLPESLFFWNPKKTTPLWRMLKGFTHDSLPVPPKHTQNAAFETRGSTQSLSRCDQVSFHCNDATLTYTVRFNTVI